MAGVSLREYAEIENNDGEKMNDEWQRALHEEVVNAAYEIIKLKGFTSWGIGLSVATIVGAIMHNGRNVFALSTNLNVCLRAFRCL